MVIILLMIKLNSWVCINILLNCEFIFNTSNICQKFFDICFSVSFCFVLPRKKIAVYQDSAKHCAFESNFQCIFFNNHILWGKILKAMDLSFNLRITDIFNSRGKVKTPTKNNRNKKQKQRFFISIPKFKISGFFYHSVLNATWKAVYLECIWAHTHLFGVHMLGYVQFSFVVWSCLTLWPMNHSTPGLPVHHQLPESTQTHVHCVGDAIQSSHPLSSPPPPAQSFPASGSFQMSQLFASGGQSIGVSETSVLPMNTQDYLL